MARDEMSGLMVRAWVLLGGALLVFKYAGILVYATTSSKIDNLIEGVWVTSKLFDMSINFMFFVLFGWALASGKGVEGMRQSCDQERQRALPLSEVRT